MDVYNRNTASHYRALTHAWPRDRIARGLTDQERLVVATRVTEGEARVFSRRRDRPTRNRSSDIE
jgi:hypothetical protein